MDRPSTPHSSLLTPPSPRASALERRGHREAADSSLLTPNSSLRTAEVGGRTYCAKAATRGCGGCAALRADGRRETALCNALPPCAGHLRGGGGDIVWAAPRGAPRAVSGE